MTMLEMLSEVIGAIELLARVAFSEFVDFLKMSHAVFPIGIGYLPRPCRSTASCKLITAIATCVGLTGSTGALMESPITT